MTDRSTALVVITPRDYHWRPVSETALPKSGPMSSEDIALYATASMSIVADLFGIGLPKLLRRQSELAQAIVMSRMFDAAGKKEDVK